MKTIFFILLLVFFSACQSTFIKNDRYKVSSASPELGSIGQSKSLFDLQNDFKVKTFAKLENNIRVSIEIVPFNKKLNHFFKAKERFNQSQSKIVYVDSLPTKPELITIRLLDVSGFTNELNADYNQSVFKLVSETKNPKIVTSIAAYLSPEEIVKIRQSDTYYLTNSQNQRYILSLYKFGKKTDTITVNPASIIAYRFSKICWSISDKEQWNIIDLTEGVNGCKKKSKIKKKKKSKSLFDM